MADHALLSPSKAHRWMACPGSVAACRDIPDKASPAGQQGTAAHALAEWCVREDRVPGEKLGTILTNDDGSQFPCDEKMVTGVAGYLETVHQLRMDHDAPITSVEVRVRAFDDAKAEVYGTADCLIVDQLGDIVDVIDLKYGAVPVEVEDNPQLKIYAVAALREAPWAARVRLTIYQPNARDIASHGARRHVEYTADELRAWRDGVLKPAADYAMQPDAPRAAGKHCQYCPAFNVCPQHTAELAAALRPSQPIPGVDAAALPSPENLTKVQLSKLLLVLPLFERWAKSVRDYGKAEIQAGRDIPGWKLVDGRRSYTWADEDEAANWLQDMMGRDAFERKLLTPAKARSMLKKQPPTVLDKLEALIECSRTVTIAPEGATEDRDDPATIFAEDII